ncbi:hypothetical protein [Faecalibacter sp. LW9]|uniref:hypothetical protein n=1 Tax=Faecalibacter sp. LW9 TaxID=3103144 RepID=UPI002AFDE7F4|nr:hypothetical protein [Faecalibacter sp. LW9]
MIKLYVSIEKYLTAHTKILWVLKEVNSADLVWDLRDALNNDIKSEHGLSYGWSNTLTPVIYTTLGILNDEDWHTMGDFTKDPDLIDCMQQVAYINVKKVGGGNVASDKKIEPFYNLNKEALHEQISLINPDVIIFGNTMKYFDWTWLKNTFRIEIEDESNPNLYSYFGKDHLLLNAYHPNNRRISHQNYCDSIIETVKNWKLKYRNQ